MCNSGRTVGFLAAVLALLAALPGSRASAADPVDEAAAEKARAYNQYYREVRKSKDRSPENLNRMRDRILAPAIVNYQKAMERSHVQALGQIEKETPGKSGKPITLRPATKGEMSGATKKSAARKKTGKKPDFSTGAARSTAKPSSAPSGPDPTVGGTQRVDEEVYEGKKKKSPSGGK